MANPTENLLNKHHNWLKTLTFMAIFCLIGGYFSAWMSVSHTSTDVLHAFLLFLVGIGAATIANATGVGGGVVFLPTFEFLNGQALFTILPAQIVGMSFIIQCFGMSTGAVTWLNRIYHHKNPDTGIPPRSFFTLIALVLLTALPALWWAQHSFTAAPEKVLFWFKALSIVLGLTLLFTTLKAGDTLKEKHHAESFDKIALLLLGAVGGVATAFFSVGVGELVALYLFIRGFPLVTSAAIAVIVSAVSVLAGVWHHLLSSPQPFELLVFIIPGAVLGGYLANRFAYWLGPKRLKIFAALWITLSSAYMLLAA